MKCILLTNCPRTVVAVIVTTPAGNSVPLCHPCLDAWFDIADDNDQADAASIAWLRPMELSG